MADDFAAIAREAIGSLPEGLRVAVTFTTDTITNDPTTGTGSVSTTSAITGTAVGVPGDPDEYAALEVVEMRSRTLVFVPDVPGAVPDERYAIVWGGLPYAVKSAVPTAPVGVALASRVVITR